MTLGPWFKRKEFACKCGCGFDTVDAVLLEALIAIREHFGHPVVVTSGCRCERHNALVGGSSNSQHKKGRAADIIVKSTSPALVADYARDLGLSVGEYDTFTHIDSRNGPPRAWWG